MSRVGKYKILLLAGAVILFVGYFLMQGLTVETTRLQVTWRMIILGIGLGPALPIYTLAIQNSVNPREIGAATSSSQFFRQVGATIGVAVFGTILAGVLSEQLPRYMPAECRRPGVGSMSFSMGQLESGNVAAVGDQIKGQLRGTYGKIEAVMTRGDRAAAKSLMEDPLLPIQYKDLINARAGSAAGSAGSRPGGDVAVALTAIRTLLDNLAATLTMQVNLALKKAFTQAVLRVYFWGLFAIAAGFIFTLFLPELALRRTHGHAGLRQEKDLQAVAPQRAREPPALHPRAAFPPPGRRPLLQKTDRPGSAATPLSADPLFQAFSLVPFTSQGFLATFALKYSHGV